MNLNRLYRVFTVVCVALVVTACAAQPPMQRMAQYSRADLRTGAAFGPAVAVPISPVQTLAVNDDMRAFLARHISSDASDHQKVGLILAAILDEGLHLDYNNFKTFTAQEAFQQREGNCLSFTNLFVALAREAGLKANFQEVEVPANWTARGDTYMYNLHINVLVSLPGKDQVIDFDMAAYNERYNRRLIPDESALAQYHNNMGVHRLNEGKVDAAFQHMQVALELRPDTGYFWTNLGTLYQHAGHDSEAEAAYLTAIELSNEPTAMSNLSRLYARIDQPELASYYRARVEIFRSRNPYYLFNMAEEAYAQSDYSRAQSLLLKAIRYRNDEVEFYRLLGLSYLQLGDKSAAQKQFMKAVELAENPVERERYNHKLYLLANN